MARIGFETIVTPSLLQRFAIEAHQEAGNGQHYAVILRDSGDLTVHHPGSPPASAEQMMFAADVLKKLNRELHHDGAWVIVFTHPAPFDPAFSIYAQPHAMYRRFVFLWLDNDGDAQIPVEWIENESEMLDFADVLTAGIEWIMQNCENAWDMWHHHKVKVIERKPDETFKRAKGQRAPSAVH